MMLLACSSDIILWILTTGWQKTLSHPSCRRVYALTPARYVGLNALIMKNLAKVNK